MSLHPATVAETGALPMGQGACAEQAPESGAALLANEPVSALGWSLRLGSWDELRDSASAVRQAVFVREQGIPQSLEWDEADSNCLHAVILDEGNRPVATGRLLPDGHIGRMAVLAECRRTGLGGQVLQALIEAARQRGHLCVALSAQVHALSFYRRHGFVAEGPIYDDVGIPHQDMTKPLEP